MSEDITSVPVAARTLIEEGGIYLLIADESPEFQSALKAASFLAHNSKAHIALLYVIEPMGFQQWGMVEDRIVAEQKRKGEEIMKLAANVLYTLHDHQPEFIIKEGNVKDVAVEVIQENPDIRALILGAGQTSNPLITYFAGKGLPNLKVPLFIIPEI